jgi:hypothetical protein
LRQVSAARHFKLVSHATTFDDELIKQARQLHPEYGGLTFREAYAVYAKNDAWCVRHGVTMYKDGS